MERSLSALLPVRNVESTLDKRVTELLEVLPELTHLFEVVIVDDGSSDATIEVADELMARFPQVTVVRHAHSIGRSEAVRTAFHQSRGDVVFLADEDCELSLDELSKMWQTLDHAEVVFGYPSRQDEQRAASWDDAATVGGGNYMMACRHIARDQLMSLGDLGALRSKITERNVRWHAIELTRRLPRLAPHHTAARARRLLSSGPATTGAGNAPEPFSSRPRQPNYLAKLRSLVFGE